jgi:hypothetical protein
MGVKCGELRRSYPLLTPFFAFSKTGWGLNPSSCREAGSGYNPALELEFIAGKPLLVDLGLYGLSTQRRPDVPAGKKPRKGQLSDHQMAYNKLLASIRVSVVHVMAGVKRLRIVKDKIRLKRNKLRDQVMLIACGLHNLRITHRKLS